MNESDKRIVETRKLVKWGSSETLIMSLPRTWVKRFHLTKDSEVSVMENPDGSLLIKPFNITNEQPKFEAKIIFDQDMMDDEDIIELEIMTKYLDGFDTIIIEKKTSKGLDKFPTKFTLKVQKVVQSLLGLEITDLFSTKIKIIDIMSIHESNIEELVKIISNSTIDIFNSLIEHIKSKNFEGSESLTLSRLQERKYYLRILRELRKGLLIPTSLSKMGLTAQDTVDLAFFVTGINETSELLEFMLNTFKNQFMEEHVVLMFVELMAKVYTCFKNSVDSFLFKKKKDAIATIKKVPELEEAKRNIENKLDELPNNKNLVHFQIGLDLNSKILDQCKNISLTALRRIL
ncbi:MAG: AbrB/MazE/SpoVT family DNA-binding domain-containing protein [Promethearchaeota archaeon]